MSKKLVIFDCDGVLVDTEYVSNKFLCNALSEYGYHISIEESIKRFTGVSAHDCRKIIMEESGIELPEDYWKKVELLLQKAYETELTPLMQPVLELLKTLKIPRCVASNSSRKYLFHTLECTQQLQYFTDQSIFSAQQVARAKPAPDLFLYAANKMGMDPADCIVVEDSAAGAQAATAAGMQVFMFFGGSHAQFDWYQNKIGADHKHLFLNCHDLGNALQQEISL